MIKRLLAFPDMPESLTEALRLGPAVRASLRPVAWLWTSLAGGAFLALLSQTVLARHLPQADFGAFAAALSAVTLASPLAGFGVAALWLERFGEEGAGFRRWTRPSLSSIALSGSLAALLVLAAGAWGGADTRIQTLLFWLSPWCLMQALQELNLARLQIENRYGELSLQQVLPVAGRFFLALLTAATGGGLAFLGAGSLVLALGLCADRTRSLWRSLPSDPSREERSASAPGLWEVPARSWPYALGALFYLVYYQADILMLGWMAGPEASAVYGIAAAVLTTTYFLPSAVYQKFLAAKLSRQAWQDPRRLWHAQRKGLPLTGLTGLAIAGLLALTAPVFIPALFGSRYAPTAGLLVLMAVCIPMRSLSIGVGSGLATPALARRRVLCQGVTAFGNIALNLLLIPKFTIWGAAAATIASEATLLLGYMWVARRLLTGKA